MLLIPGYLVFDPYAEYLEGQVQALERENAMLRAELERRRGQHDEPK